MYPTLSAFFNICLIYLLQFSDIFPTHPGFFSIHNDNFVSHSVVFLWQKYRNIPKSCKFKTTYKGPMFTKIMCAKLNNIHKDYSCASDMGCSSEGSTFPTSTTPWVHHQHWKNNESMPQAFYRVFLGGVRGLEEGEQVFQEFSSSGPLVFQGQQELQVDRRKDTKRRKSIFRFSMPSPFSSYHASLSSFCCPLSCWAIPCYDGPHFFHPCTHPSPP